jgi:hypothetical protein
MMYVRDDYLAKFRDDYLRLIEDALTARPPASASPEER